MQDQPVDTDKYRMNAGSARTSSPVVPSRSAGAVPTTSKCLVVMYHYVHDRFEGSELLAHKGKGVRGLSVAEFESQLDVLTSRFEPLDWPTLRNGLRGKSALPARSFLLTFDDGLREHAQTVLPVLERRKLCGVFFVPGCVLTKPRMLSAHAVHLLLEVLGEAGLAAELKKTLRELGGDFDLDDTEIEQAQRTYSYEQASMAQLKFLINMKLPLATRASVVGRLFERHVGPHADWSKRWYLNSSGVREIQSKGHTLGGHSFAHEPYGRLSAADLERDIAQSAWSLRDLLGPGDRPFAFPFGSVHPRASGLLNAAGFVHAFTTVPGYVAKESQVMSLSRVDTIAVNAALKETKS